MQRAVFTYYTNNGSNKNCNFPFFEAFASTFKRAVEAATNYFPLVLIYTDVPDTVMQIMIGLDGVVIVPTDFSQISFNKHFWNYPKLITYALQDEPFLHLDNDFILLEKPKNLDAPILCEAMRQVLIKPSKYTELGLEHIPQLTNTLCSGALGGNNLNLFKDLLSVAETTQEYAGSVRHLDKSHLMLIEEIVLTNLAGYNNIKTIDCKYKHYQGIEKVNALNYGHIK